MLDYGWYYFIQKPALTPPYWVFAPVWLFLYTTLVISLVFYLKSTANKSLQPNGESPTYKPLQVNEKCFALTLFFLQILLNFSWSPVFFGLHDIETACIIAFLMVILTFLVILLFFMRSKISAFILIPYFLWIVFALYLNFEIIRLNQPLWAV